MFKSVRCAALLLAIATILLGGCNPSSRSGSAASSDHVVSAPQIVLTQPVGKYSLVVPVVIGGKEYHFLLDTGSAFTVVDNHIASRFTQPAGDKDIPAILREGFADGGVTTPGESLRKEDVVFWRAQPLTIGNRTLLSALPWMGSDLSSMSQALGQPIDGLIGNPIVRQLAWKVDNKERTLTVWDSTPSLKEYEHCVPYQHSYSQPPQIKMDSKQGPWLSLSIDTGATDMFLSTETLTALHKAGLGIERTGSSGLATVNGKNQTGTYLVAGFVFNGVPLGHVTAVETANLDNIGTSFLSRLDRYLLAPADMLFCYDSGDLGRDDRAAWRYIDLVYQNEHVEIGHSDSAQLNTYGLEDGDILLEVNNRPVQPGDIAELRETIYKAPKGQLQIVIDRHGVKKVLRL